MFDERVILPEQLPVRQKQRKCTDCCCTIVGTIFALTMFILACCMWNKDNFDNHFRNNTSSNGHNCEEGQYVFIADANDYNSRQCRSSCPVDFAASNSRICFPQDQDQRRNYLGNPQITQSYDHDGFKKTLFYTFFIAIGCGLLRMTLTHCLPRYMPMITFVIAALLLIFFGVFALATSILSKSIGGWSIGVAVLLIILAIILLVMLCMYSNQIMFQGYMLEYATMFLNHNPQVFLYIPIFILFFFGLAALILLQHSCYASSYANGNNFWNLTIGGVLDILNVLQFIWGLQFLRDAFNFCVSGNAVDWYWTRQASCYQPYQRLLCKNWGSVVGGSFLNAFFQIPTLIVQLLVCHPETCCSKLGTTCYNKCNVFTCFFDLVRTDAYSYINLTGIPFCDSARQCSKLCDRSNQFIGYHSAMKHYRFAAHIACIAFVFLWAFWVLNYRTFNYSMWQVAILIMFIYGIVTWFIGIHTDAAEGLQTSYLAQLQLQGQHQYMQKIHPSMRKILQPHQNRILKDGNL